jgi:phospholipid/cholesterol/gamma-HCH transport system substrate-binding protein
MPLFKATRSKRFQLSAQKINRMKISNETKVGVLTIIALTLLIIGFNFLKGRDLFNKSTKLYAIFTDLGSLEKANDVKINGLPIGKVYELNEVDPEVSAIRVTITLKKNVKIPVNSIAYISAGLLGSSYIIIEKGDANTFLKNGDTIHTRIDPSFLTDFREQLNPTLVKVRNALDTVNVVLKNINRIFDNETKNNLQQTIANLADASNSLKSLLKDDGSPLIKTLHNANAVAENLKKNSDSITAVISNAKKITSNLAELNLQHTIDSVHSVLTELKNTMAKVTSKEGTLGALISDRQLYNKINDAILSAEILMDDLRTHPKRYVNISVFGKKDKSGPLTSPAKKDTTHSGGNK